MELKLKQLADYCNGCKLDKYNKIIKVKKIVSEKISKGYIEHKSRKFIVIISLAITAFVLKPVDFNVIYLTWLFYFINCEYLYSSAPSILKLKVATKIVGYCQYHKAYQK